MSDNVYAVAREFSNVTSCVRDDEGYWKVTVTATESAEYSDGTSRKADTSAMSIDRDPQTAIETAMKSVLDYLSSVVYKQGFAGLIEYRQYEEAVKEAKKKIETAVPVGSTQINTNTEVN